MNDKPAAAPRIRTPGWRDPRLVIGILLVAISVAGVVALMQSTDAREGYWAASVDLVPGVKAQPEDFHVVQASLSEASDKYWLASDPLPDGFYVGSTVLQGEFLAQRQVSEADPSGRQQVGVRVSEDVSDSVTTGSRADVWVALAEADGRGYQEPQKLIANAEVVGIAENASTFAAADTTTVYLMLSQDALPDVLNAQANGAKISLVPATAGN
ncbi:MAG TPA: flagellar biosynthesis protein FlgA [Enteractinococcus sp.]